jgi:hypothetical protein
MLFAAIATIASLAISASASCTKIGDMTHTFYGYPDNSPAGPAIAHDCGRGYSAGGTGTYSDPLTFASATSEFSWCEIIYDPYTKKYLRMEDDCEQCETDWSNGIWHIDVWTGSTTVNGGQDQINCEDDLTPEERSQTIVRRPDSTYPVDSEFSTLFLKWII